MKQEFPLINTPLQRGDWATRHVTNRFSGLSSSTIPSHDAETAEAVWSVSARACTPLKRGVNERVEKDSAPATVLCRDHRARLSFWLVALLGVMPLAGCGHKGEPRGTEAADLSPVVVRTQAVESKKIPALEEVVGTVRARLRATIEAKTTGRITEMAVVLGQRVKAGELVARLDAPEINARLEQAEAGLQQAERDWKRVSSLFSQQAATQSDYDAANSRYLVAKGAVAEAKALMAYVEILAPFTGVVTKKWVDVGDQAAPGKPLIDLEDPAKLQLEADVPEAIAGKVRQNARMTIRVSDPSGELSGTVTEIAPTADPASRTFRVKLDLPSDQDSPLPTPHSPLLMSGQFARLLVPVGETTAMRVPASAVIQRGQLEIVFAVENQHARLHLVKTGRQLNGEMEILSGLDSGDAVVIDNVSQLVDGQPVNVR